MSRQALLKLRREWFGGGFGRLGGPHGSEHLLPLHGSTIIRNKTNEFWWGIADIATVADIALKFCKMRR